MRMKTCCKSLSYIATHIVYNYKVIRGCIHIKENYSHDFKEYYSHDTLCTIMKLFSVVQTSNNYIPISQSTFKQLIVIIVQL